MNEATPEVVAVRLLQTGGIAGLEMSAALQLAELPAAVADRTRRLAEQVLGELPVSATSTGPTRFDALEYELFILRAGLSACRVVTRDGELTPAQQDLIGILRPRLMPG